MHGDNVIPLRSSTSVVRCTVGGVAVVSGTGDIDLSVQPALSVALLHAVASSEAVLFDLCACTFLDSTGLEALLVASRAARSRGVPMVVAAEPGGAPRALIELVVGQGLFESCDSREAGLAALAAMARAGA